MGQIFGPRADRPVNNAGRTERLATCGNWPHKDFFAKRRWWRQEWFEARVRNHASPFLIDLKRQEDELGSGNLNQAENILALTMCN